MPCGIKAAKTKVFCFSELAVDSDLMDAANELLIEMKIDDLTGADGLPERTTVRVAQINLHSLTRIVLRAKYFSSLSPLTMH